MGLGFRVPLVVISPYAKHGYVSHVQHEFGSVLKFIEETYSLPSLGQADVRADDLSDFFDLSQTPAPLRKPRTDAQARSQHPALHAPHSLAAAAGQRLKETPLLAFWR